MNHLTKEAIFERVASSFLHPGKSAKIKGTIEEVLPDDYTVR